MKDNYSWLNDLMGWYERDGETWQPKSWEMSEDLNVTNVKQTIISQIEIEKLRAIREQRADAIKSYKKILKLEQAELQAQAKKDK
jgi:hypothetical protein